MTRPRRASEAFLAGLPDPVLHRFQPLFSPLIEIVDLKAQVTLTERDAAIFTSANGVHAAPLGEGRTAYCVGAATTAAAQSRGWNATQSGTDANSLVAALTSLKPRQTLFHLSGLHTRGDIAARLGATGLKVQNIALYDQQLCDLTNEATQILLREKRVVVPLFSPRTAAQFVQVAPRTTSVHAIALSPAVSDALGPGEFAAVTIAARPDAQAMGNALAEVT